VRFARLSPNQGHGDPSPWPCFFAFHFWQAPRSLLISYVRNWDLMSAHTQFSAWQLWRKADDHRQGSFRPDLAISDHAKGTHAPFWSASLALKVVDAMGLQNSG
jgi:hypothetical protein